MQITRAADYAVRAMVHLASIPATERAPLAALAKATEAPESFLSKVLQSLTRAGLVASRRGLSGGFELQDRGREATMLEVIEVIDGRTCLNACMVSPGACPRSPSCPVHPVWAEVQGTVLSVLGRTTIAALAARAGGNTRSQA